MKGLIPLVGIIAILMVVTALKQPEVQDDVTMSVVSSEQLEQAMEEPSSSSDSSSSVGVVLENLEPVGEFFFKDDESVYITARTADGVEVVDSADPATFELIENGDYARDANTLYWISYEMGGPYIHIVEDIDPSTFQVLGNWYTKDAQHVLYSLEVIQGADPVTFDILDIMIPSPYGDIYPFSRDVNHLYYYGLQLPDVSPDMEIVTEGVEDYFFQRGDQLTYIVPIGGGALRVPGGVILLDVEGKQLEKFISHGQKENRLSIYDFA